MHYKRKILLEDIIDMYIHNNCIATYSLNFRVATSKVPIKFIYVDVLLSKNQELCE